MDHEIVGIEGKGEGAYKKSTKFGLYTYQGH